MDANFTQNNPGYSPDLHNPLTLAFVPGAAERLNAVHELQQNPLWGVAIQQLNSFRQNSGNPPLDANEIEAIKRLHDAYKQNQQQNSCRQKNLNQKQL